MFSLSTNGTGGLTLPFAWPAGLPSGIPFYNQAWITDPTAPSGFSATNGLQGTTP
ncbi:MAG: hypothetical protein ACI9EF_001830 [Pseudohongiellaceae bacterium]